MVAMVGLGRGRDSSQLHPRDGRRPRTAPAPVSPGSSARLDRRKAWLMRAVLVRVLAHLHVAWTILWPAAAPAGPPAREPARGCVRDGWKDYLKALVMAFRLNEKYLIHRLYEGTPVEDVALVAEGEANEETFAH